MFENPRSGRQARNFTTNVPKILDLKSSSEEIFSENCRWVPLIMANLDSIRRSLSRFVKKKNSFRVLFIRCSCHFLSKVITEGVVGGSHCDIAISDAMLSVNESCSFMPKEAQLSANGK